MIGCHHSDHTTRVGERGQITISKAIREELGIYAGDETVQHVEDGRIVIEVVPGRHHRSLAGSLREKVGRRPADESWPAVRDAAWRAPDPDRRPLIGVDTSVVVRYLVGTPLDQARQAAGLIDADAVEIGVSIVALAECAHVLRTQYAVDQRDIVDSLIDFVQRANVTVVDARLDIPGRRARPEPGRCRVGRSPTR